MQPRESPREMANGRWHGLLGKWLDEKALAGKHTTCPMCGGVDRFRMDDKGGDGRWICNHCGAGDGLHLLQHLAGLTFPEAARYVEQHAGRVEAKPAAPGRSEADVKEALQKAWKGSQRIERTDPVGKYLEGRCGGPVTFPSCLRYHPALPYRHDDGTSTAHPGMLAQVLGADGKGVTIHRTYLTQDGAKAALDPVRKLMTPTRKLENVAIRLGPVDSGWLGVAEGLETALCASKKHGIPVWACTSAGLLKSFRPPPEVKTLYVCADNDRSFTGQAAAYELARVVTNLGIECRVLMPPEEGTDWADDWKARASP